MDEKVCVNESGRACVCIYYQVVVVLESLSQAISFRTVKSLAQKVVLAFHCSNKCVDSTCLQKIAKKSPVFSCEFYVTSGENSTVYTSLNIWCCGGGTIVYY